MLVLQKRSFFLRILTFAFAVAVLACMSIDANATLIKSYDFNDNLSDTLSNGLELVASGGTLSGGRYSFSHNQGLRLSDALLSTTDYAIELKFQMNDSLAGFNKLIDFQDLSSDYGLYTYWRELDFYTIGQRGGTVPRDTDVTVGLARSGGNIELFLNGASLFTAADPDGQAVSSSNILNFFEDDITWDPNQPESFIGSVDFIRIHEDSSTFSNAPSATLGTTPVPEPATLILLSSGLIGLAGFRRKYRKK